jgi:CxxC-x17-CxxC domain-containing protein
MMSSRKGHAAARVINAGVVRQLPPEPWRVLKASATIKGGSFKVSFTDKTLTCKDCGQEFIWTSGEQEFYQTRGLVNEPGRCPTCRAARRASGGAGTSYGSRGMGGPREFYSATCSNCGNEARVPFQPRGDKPVYCSSCFEQVRPSASRRYA